MTSKDGRIAFAQPGRLSLSARVKNAALGTESQPQRSRTTHSAMALAVFAMFAVVQQFEVTSGHIDQLASNLLSLYTAVSAISFYVLVRSGLNQKFTSDPSLSFAQCVFGISAVSASYAVTGPARGGVMGIMLLILVFAMFAMKPAQISKLSWCAFGALGLAMLTGHYTQPDRYPVSVEMTHALIALILVTSISVLSIRMGSLRALLERQKSELEHALEQNWRLVALDELTGLVNRRHMGTILQAEHARQQRGSQGMSLALIDIDFFKRVNDLHGHAAGDTVLRRFAQLATATLRTCDITARWGGEEFLIVMPETTTDEAVLAIDRLRVAFSRLSFDQIDPDLRATFSAGVATHLDQESVDDFVARADCGMYAAKGSGRNRVCSEPAPDHLTCSVG